MIAAQVRRAAIFALAGLFAAAMTADGSRDLRADEALGGHTIARHVGRSDAFLAQRLAEEPEIADASSFESLAEAEQAVGAALQARADAIAAWTVGRGPDGRRRVLRLDQDVGWPVGRVLERGRAAPVVTSRVRVILRRLAAADRPWFVLTAFPEP